MSAFLSKRCVMRVIFLKVLGIFLLTLLLSFQVNRATCAANVGGDPSITEQEQWVLRQIMAGSEADLKTGFTGEDTKHRLSASFLKKLLVGHFKDLRIPHQGVNIANAVIEGPLDLKYLEIDYPLTLSHCLFQDQVTFAESHCKKDLSLVGSTFLKSAHFKGIKIGGSVICDRTIFEGESLWCDAKIGEKFLAVGAEFRSTVGKADFNTMKVGTNAHFISARFHGPADFGLVHIGRQLIMNKAEFFHEKETAYFSDMMVEQLAHFKGARFHGPVNFVIVLIGLQFNADGAEFLNPEELADFRSIRAGSTIFFRGAQFHGPVKFDHAKIAVNFRATGAGFFNANQPKSFAKMKVGQKAFLDGITILGNVDLSYGEFYDVEISGAKEVRESDQARGIEKLNLKGMLVQRELTIADDCIAELDASHMQVKGPAIFRNIEIITKADFRNSTFQGMDFQKVIWPQKEEGKIVRKVCLSDLTYSSISIDRQEDGGDRDYSDEDFEAIKKFIEATPFSTQTYVQLEDFFKRIGKDSWAKKVFIRMHDRELAEKMHWYDPRRWLEWFFWGRLAGYGRAPFRVFFISLAIIILGAFLFDPEYLTDNKKSAEGRTYKSMLIRFFLSLDRFLPIELGLAKSWDAKANRFLIWFYFHLQQILGWILIPIALASIYSQIK
jgi:uncharacterized protein YjbI with pentapeptide repeats